MSHTGSKSHRLRWGTACLLMAVLVSGCAHRVTISTWKPAQIEVSGMQRLAVLGFAGEQGDAITNALTTKLSDNEFYTLVDRRQLEPIQWVSAGRVSAQLVSGSTGNPGLLSLDDLNAAREAGIDGIIVGDVIDSRCEDHPLSERKRRWGWIPQWKERTPKEREDRRTETDTDSPLRREATVTIAFRLLEGESGKIRASREISHSSADVLIDHGNGTPAPIETLNELTRKCVDEFVSTLAPHQVTERVKLAKPVLFQAGCSLVHNGNEFASRGRWEEAIVAWEQALATNPDNDAALFNLSIAHANRQDFTRAETFAIRAMNVRQKEKYQAGLQRVRDQSSAYDQTLKQRRDLSMMPLTP